LIVGGVDPKLEGCRGVRGNRNIPGARSRWFCAWPEAFLDNIFFSNSGRKLVE